MYIMTNLIRPYALKKHVHSTTPSYIYPCENQCQIEGGNYIIPPLKFKGGVKALRTFADKGGGI